MQGLVHRRRPATTVEEQAAASGNRYDDIAEAGADPLHRPSPGGRSARAAGRGSPRLVRWRDRLANSEPLTPEGLRGRVVLVDFWTYTCVNWLRTLPYVRAWAAKYARRRADGRRRAHAGVRLRARLRQRDRPVARPRGRLSRRGRQRLRRLARLRQPLLAGLYLADAEGRIRYHHFGEGEYAMTEMAIQQLLLEAGADDLDQDLVMVEPRGLEVAADWRTLRSPETYLGYGQSTGFASGRRRAVRRAARLRRDAAAAAQRTGTSPGPGRSPARRACSNEPGGRVAFQFHARDVNLVMGPTAGAGLDPVPRLPRRPGGGRRRRHRRRRPTAAGRLDDQRTYQLSASQDRSPSAGSRSSSWTPAPRRTASPSADSAQPDPRQEERHTHYPARWNNARLRADAPCSRRGRSGRVRHLTGCSSSLVPAAVWCPPRP